jgi:FtsP/CotA-like multicopper oxidase with cupredoxin domain/plastocyanin
VRMPRRSVVGTRLVVGLMVLALSLAVACKPASVKTGAATAAGAAAAAPVPQEVRVTVSEWAFTPDKLRLPGGQPVTLILDNKGQLDHDLTIPQLNVQLTAAAGRSARATVTAAKDGTYDVYCSIAGHRELGMKATASVSGAGAGHDLNAHEAAALNASAVQVADHVSHATVATTATRGNEEIAYRLADDGVKVFELKAQHVNWEVVPGEFVDAYGYNGQVPGPVLRVQEGDRMRVNFTNELPEPTVMHFHGNRLPNAMDGVPDVTQPVVAPGETYSYEFVAEPAGTFIYHTHHNSAVQEPKGLYGMFLIEPKDGPRVQADKEVIQVLSELGGYYVINGKAFPATEPIPTKVGERVLVRLANLGQMTHPMHLHGHPFKIVATDGYPVPEGQALTKDVINIGPGERYDLLIELDNPGTWVFHCHILSHVQNKGVEPGGMITVFQVAAS